MTRSNQPSHNPHFDNDVDHIGELLTTRYSSISVYTVVMLMLAVMIVWTSVLAAKQVQQYHLDYRVLQDMKNQYRRLQVEHQRLLIEQQTYSATPQIASRAVTELGMYTPTVKDKWILQPSVYPKPLPKIVSNNIDRLNTGLKDRNKQEAAHE